MDYTKLLADYLQQYYYPNYGDIVIKAWEDLGHTIRVTYRGKNYQMNNSIDITPFELLTFIYTQKISK